MQISELHLSRLSAEEILQLGPVLRDPQVVGPSRLQLPANPVAFRWALTTLANNHHCFGIRFGRKAKLVGLVCADPVVDADGQMIPHTLTISYLLDRHYWGRQIMTKAVQLFCQSVNVWDPDLVILAEVLRTNQRSIKVLQNANFQLDQRRPASTKSNSEVTCWRWSRRENRPKQLAPGLSLRV